MGRLGHPERSYPVFHVAGTNGKGSTVATLDAILRGAGLRVGRYMSPHLVDFAERIVIDGAPVPHPWIADWLARHDDLLGELGTTFFEATTAMAFDRFATGEVDVAVVEVGLGGRLDATNVVHPVAAGVTQIGFDHMEYLGDTLPRIAAEKAGIFKPGVGAVVGDAQPEVRAVLEQQAERVGSTPILVTGRDWEVSGISVGPEGTRFTLRDAEGTRALTTPLVGAFQAHNCAVALGMLRSAGGRWADIGREAGRWLGDVRLAGRFHRAGRWLFDVAHNADGAATVVGNVRAVGGDQPVAAVVSVLRDKDWRGILTSVASVASPVILTDAPTAPASRRWSLHDVEAWAAEAGLPVICVADFDAALASAQSLGSTVLVTGSFHTVGDAMNRLQVAPLAR
jgi:dihydrofolate synthase/folylpolyglutamate synthase